MRCIFSCLGDKKSRRRRISTPSKDQDHGAYEIIKPIKTATVEEEKTKLPIIHSKEKNEDRLDGVIKEKVISDFTNENLGTESLSEAKKEEKQKIEQTQSQINQAHSDSSMSSLFSYPINKRYKNSSSTDDDHGFVQQESSDSLFSISVNSKRQSEPGEKEVNSSMKLCEPTEKEIKKTQSNQSRLNPNHKTTRSNVCNLEKLIIMDDQEEKDNVKEDQETSLPFSSNEDPIFKQRLNFPEAEKETEIIILDQSAKIKSITNTIENITQSNAGKLGDLILMDEQEDKENIKSDQEIFKKISIFSDENKSTRLNHGLKNISLLNPIENLTQLKTGDSGRFILMDDQGEKEKIVADQENIPLTCCREPSFKKSFKFSKTKVKEILVDTSLSSWLVESERESDSPKSVKNSPDMKNIPLRRYSNDNTLSEKDMTIVGTIGSFLESNSMQTPQARTNKLKV